MVTMAGLMITVMAWIFYGEKLSVGQLIGMVAVITAVIMMGFFQETEDEAEVQTGASGETQPEVISSDK